jgi:excisionase family DNA binding protein
VREDANHRPSTVDNANNRLLTINEAYAMLRVSKSMIYSLIHDKRLASVKIGRRRLIPFKSLEAYLTELSAQESV